jgi:hypothetical protein
MHAPSVPSQIAHARAVSRYSSSILEVDVKRRHLVVPVVVALAATTGGLALSSALAGPPPPAFNSVKPQVFDPGDTDTAQSMWINGIGCPNATATHNTNNANGSVSDPQCAGSYDASDEENAGLLLSKEGPSSSNSSGTATLGGIAPNTHVTELGYDIRTVNYPGSLSSHCGNGSPRFNVTTTDGLFFVGCDSPQADSFTSDTAGSGGAWTRLRWGTGGTVQGYGPSGLGPITGTVKSISILFDDGTEVGPDYFGAAVLDNIDFNGAIVGRN